MGMKPRAGYDEKLAERIRSMLGPVRGVSERKMFGGLAFLIGGHMAVAAGSGGGLMVRVDPEASDELTSSTPARLMEMGGGQMRGWLVADAADVADAARLREWVDRGTAYARSLPPKG